MRITRKSMVTGKTHTLDLPVTEEQLAAYEAGAQLQVAFPDLPAPQREFIKTGITPEEWLKHVIGPAEEPDDEEDETQPEDTAELSDNESSPAGKIEDDILDFREAFTLARDILEVAAGRAELAEVKERIKRYLSKSRTAAENTEETSSHESTETEGEEE